MIKINSLQTSIGTLVLLSFLTAAVLSLGGDAAARDDCYAWSQARSIITKEKLLPARKVTDQVIKQYGGKLIGAKLCERRGRFVYDVTVLASSGQVTEVTVDSRSGRHINARGASSSQRQKPKLQRGNSIGFGLPKLWK